MQAEYMNEEAREQFLSRFCQEPDTEFDLEGKICMDIEEENRSIVGFCVLGGIFSEGIDLKGEALIGALIVGTGLPQVCREREILMDYFEAEGKDGFDYAYRYPGMNKVLQAAGRVIRSVSDKGIVALLDDRFELPVYRKMFPREWEAYDMVNMKNCHVSIEDFWNGRNNNKFSL